MSESSAGPLESISAEIAVVLSYFKGARLAAFEGSIAVVRESVGQGTWVPRGRARAGKGIKSIAPDKDLISPPMSLDSRRNSLFRCYMSAAFGSPLHLSDIDAATDAELTAIAPKVPVDTMRAWLRLIVALHEIYADLAGSRPRTIYTEIGLSPKVTKTLKDASLDLDLTTRRVCPIAWRWSNAYDKNGDIIHDKHGVPLKVKFYFADWPDDTVFGASRFSHSDCEACGKSIPSRMVVPILVSDHAGRPLGFWFGRDCARNILGIKDAGIEDTRPLEEATRLYKPTAELADHPRPHNALPPRASWDPANPYWVAAGNPGAWGKPHRSSADERAHQALLGRVEARNAKIDTLTREHFAPGSKVTYTQTHTHTWTRKTKGGAMEWCACEAFTTTHEGIVSGDPWLFAGVVMVSVQAPSSNGSRGVSTSVAAETLLVQAGLYAELRDKGLNK